MRRSGAENYSRVQEFLQSYLRYHGELPTVREIERRTGVSRSAVGRILQRLEEQGVIVSHGKRGYLSAEADKKMQLPSVPVAGRISCGFTKLAVQEIDGYISLPQCSLGGGELFALVADGTSMINIGIEPGDYVVCRQQSWADKGQVIVALVDGEEATLKRYYPNPEEGYVDLVPENDDMPVQRVDLTNGTAFEIQGVAVKAIRMTDVK